MNEGNVGPAVEEARAVWDRFLSTIRNSKLLISFVFLSTVLATYGALQLRSELYETEARILVKLGRENVEVPATVEKGDVVTMGVRMEEINSYVLLMSSRALLEETLDTIGIERFRAKPVRPETFAQRVKFQVKEAVRRVRAKVDELLIALNLEEELSEREELLVALGSSLEVDRRKDSDVISVRLRLPDPELAVEFVDTLLRLYINRHIQVRRDSGSTGFFAGEAADYKHQLTTIEKRRADLKREFALTSIDEERELLLRRLHQIYGEIADDERERALIGRSGTAEALSEDNGGTEDALDSNLTIPLMKDRVTELRMNRVGLASKYQQGSRLMVETESEIERLESMLIRALSGRIRERSAQATEIESRLQTLSASEDQLGSLERERMLAEQNYMSYAKRVEESRISSELDDRRVANVAILAAPSRPIEPVTPKKVMIMGLSIPAGILLGMGLALLLDYFSDRVREPADLGGIPYLGTFRISR